MSDESETKKAEARQAILNNYKSAAQDMMDAGMPVPGMTQTRTKGREFILGFTGKWRRLK